VAFEPPDRVVVSWDNSPFWQVETDLDHTSEVEVRKRQLRSPPPSTSSSRRQI